MRFRLRNVIAIGALTSGLIAGGALVADAATTTSTTNTTSGTSGSTSPTPASSSTASSGSGSTKHCTDMGTGSGSSPTQGEVPATAPTSG
jgi:hypothetical protein